MKTIEDILYFLQNQQKLNNKVEIVYKNIIKNFPVEAIILNTQLYDFYKTSKVAFISIKSNNDPLEKYQENVKSINPILIISDEHCNYKNFLDYNLIVIKNLKEILPYLLKYFYNLDFGNMNIFGITGTNGKTTITTILHQLFSKLYQEDSIFRSSLIGTVKYKIDKNVILQSSTSIVPLTTPDICTTYLLLYLSQKEKVKNIFMEVSSHSLDQERIKGLEFKITAFSNLSQDHLDYHKTMENYFNAKKKLFLDYPSLFKIINTKNKYGKILYKELENKFPNIINFNIRKIRNEFQKDKLLLKFNLVFNDPILKTLIKQEIETNLVGKFNLENISIVFITTYLMVKYVLNLEDKEIIFKIREYLKEIELDIGRMELVSCNPFVFVDYAHSPDALKNTLKTLKSLQKTKDKGNETKLIVVFGAGGDRDKKKRPLMGKVASKYSDLIVLTSDNPRSEDPLAIINDIKKGIKNLDNLIIEPDREKAIEKAIKVASSNDIILIAGKGHENYQIIKNNIIPFNDKEIVKKHIKKPLKIK